MKSQVALSFPLILFLFFACSPAPTPDGPEGDIGSRIDPVFAEFMEPGSPGAVAMVIQDGEVVHAKGYGLANLSTGQTLTRNTTVRLGSVGKQFTSMAIMVLKDRGLLAFDDPVTNWVPEVSRFPGVRVHHLLQHTSGIPDYYELPDSVFAQVASSDGDPVLTNEDAVTLYEDWGEAVSEPGERYAYCNPCYEILALIVERASGQTFGEFLGETVFEPLGMETAIVRDRPELDIPDRAIGYRPNRDGEGWMENDDHYGNWLVGAGGVYASLDDLFLWDQALYTEELVERGTLDEAFSPTILNDGSVSEYGFGWNVADLQGHKAVHHGGSWVGFRTFIARFIDDRLTVIVLSNASASAGDLADEVAKLFLES